MGFISYNPVVLSLRGQGFWLFFEFPFSIVCGDFGESRIKCLQFLRYFLCQGIKNDIICCSLSMFLTLSAFQKSSTATWQEFFCVFCFPKEQKFVCSDLEVDYESQEIASIVYSALDVDKEVTPDPSLLLNHHLIG